ncbi:hypothetical protein SAMN05216167_103189 [Spirosoma endophyticum]|uniref:Uncharacterized protein n=1 Tax=Spirosoma endophyticum TaxID=662367 RepID=A0A1I1PLC7_9BACT|nr:hypothetical protein SAMN05216167_103189 [Spirosoma endophyticum]
MNYSDMEQQLQGDLLLSVKLLCYDLLLLIYDFSNIRVYAFFKSSVKKIVVFTPIFVSLFLKTT